MRIGLFGGISRQHIIELSSILCRGGGAQEGRWGSALFAIVPRPAPGARGADRCNTFLGLAAGLVWERATFRKWEDGYSFVCAAPRRPVRAYGRVVHHHRLCRSRGALCFIILSLNLS